MIALSTSCYVDDVVVSGNKPDCQNGVPFGPTFLGYPLTEIDADYTIGPIRLTLRFLKKYPFGFAEAKRWTTSQI